MVAQPVGRRGILDGWVSRRYNSGQHLPAASAGQRHTDLIGSWMWLGSVCATGIGLVMLVVCATCLQGMHVNQSYVIEIGLDLCGRGDCVFVNAVFSSDIQPRIPKRHEFHPIKTLIYEQHNVLISVKWSENRQYQSENRQYQSHTM